MRLLLINDSDVQIDEAFVSDWVKRLTRELVGREILNQDQASKELSVVFLKEVDAKNLNWSYRQRDYPTDVLSFETEDPDSLGELVLCPSVLKKQSVEHKLSFELETGYMILHGVLHLLGYDHEKDEDEADRMMGLQDEVFEVLRAPPKPVRKKASSAKKTTAPAKKAAPKKAPAKKKAARKTRN